MSSVLVRPELASQGLRPADGVRDMIHISDINENGINTNLKVRYRKDLIYINDWFNRHRSNLKVVTRTKKYQGVITKLVQRL